MCSFLRDAGIRNKTLQEAYERFHDTSEICAFTGSPRDRRKVSISHINEAFNYAIQDDYMMVYIKSEEFEILNIVDSGTRYGKRAIYGDRSAEKMTAMI